MQNAWTNFAVFSSEKVFENTESENAGWGKYPRSATKKGSKNSRDLIIQRNLVVFGNDVVLTLYFTEKETLSVGEFQHHWHQHALVSLRQTHFAVVLAFRIFSPNQRNNKVAKNLVHFILALEAVIFASLAKVNSL